MRVLISLFRASVRQHADDEQGIAMVSVVGMSAILFAVAAIVMTRNLSDYNLVRSDRRFEQAIQVADSGVDHTLFKVGASTTYTTGEILPTSFASTQAEKDWVMSNAADNYLVTTPEGQWATIRPMNADVIYSVGYVPTRVDPFKIRVIRAAYDYAPFVPSVAILTDGDLEIQGSATITGAGGSVHANGDVSLSGSPNISGYVSASGDYSPGGTVGDPVNSGGGKPPREVPVIDPRENYLMSEYDLCPNGDVRTGPSYSAGGGFLPNATDVPCGGALLDDGFGQGYRGWKVTAGLPAQWKYNDNTAYDGVYYIYQGSAEITGNPGSTELPWKVSIFAEAISGGSEPDHCPHQGGDIVVNGGGDMKRHDTSQPLHLIAGRDLQLHGNPGTHWEGVYAAHEQFDITGNTDLTGVIIANDYCDSSGSPVSDATVNLSGSAHIDYDGLMEIPIGRRIRTTHWNEL